jgi:hypothetical protein
VDSKYRIHFKFRGYIIAVKLTVQEKKSDTTSDENGTVIVCCAAYLCLPDL